MCLSGYKSSCKNNTCYSTSLRSLTNMEKKCLQAVHAGRIFLGYKTCLFELQEVKCIKRKSLFRIKISFVRSTLISLYRSCLYFVFESVLHVSVVFKGMQWILNFPEFDKRHFAWCYMKQPLSAFSHWSILKYVINIIVLLHYLVSIHYNTRHSKHRDFSRSSIQDIWMVYIKFSNITVILNSTGCTLK